KSKLRNQLKHDAYYATRNANAEMWEPTGPLVMHLTVYHGKGRKRMDDDNIIAWSKPLRDGIAQAIGIDDKHITTGTIDQLRDPDGLGFVEVTVESEVQA